ncbi:hypothetical protein HDU76_007923 [Blyttiomyces sp. JEL0837]|nr:hypothetical protein HDU76_007923 [Blyttiomyces sp. JEL0837]
MKGPLDVLYRTWARKYGGIFLYRGFGNLPRVVVSTESGIRRVLTTHSHLYKKFAIGPLYDFVGKGLLVVAGDTHKRQRKMLNPVFRVGHINALVPVFSHAATELRQNWEKQFMDASSDDARLIDIGVDMSKVTLDVIGRAGFGYEFHSMDGKTSELSKTMNRIVDNLSPTPLMVLERVFPWIRHFPFARFQKRQMDKKITDRLVEEIIAKRKADVASGIHQSDLMSILIKENMEGEATEQLSHEEVMSQVFTFVLAGHETTSTSLTWALHALSLHPEIQDRLREELVQALPNRHDEPSAEVLNKLQYLDAFMKETLRYYPPVPAFRRMAAVDDEIDGIKIPKGTTIIVSPAITHRLEQYWGPDVDEFVPTRWISENEHDCHGGHGDGDHTVDGGHRAFGAFFPFSLGTRNCIGSR